MPIIGDIELSAVVPTASPATLSSDSAVAPAVISTDVSPILPGTVPSGTALNATPLIATTSRQAPGRSSPSPPESSPGVSSVVTSLPANASVTPRSSSVPANADNEPAATSTPATASASVSATNARGLSQNKMTGTLALSIPGGPARALRLFPSNLSDGPALDQIAADLEVPSLGRARADSPDTLGPAVARALPNDVVSSPERLTGAGLDTTGIPAMSASDLARAWEAAGDWLADLAKAEAAEATELAARLAPVLAAAGVFLSWGTAYHSTRMIARERDDELTRLEIG